MDHLETEILKINSLRAGDYHVTFLSCHPADKSLECHKYYLDDNDVLVYDARILITPKRKPYLVKYILWSDSIHLTDYFVLYMALLVLTRTLTLILPKQNCFTLLEVPSYIIE